MQKLIEYKIEQVLNVENKNIDIIVKLTLKALKIKEVFIY